jgi:biopolymer transport protein ExbD
MNKQREFRVLTLAILLCLSPAMLFSQNAPEAQGQSAVVTAAAPQPATVSATGKLVLKEGTDVKLKFADDLSSKTAVDDDPVNLILDEDVKVGDVVVAKAGCKGVGIVTNAKKAGMMGKAGELNLRLEHLTVGDQRVRLRGSKGKEGEGKVGTAVALTVLFGPIGLIKHGKNVEVKAGTPLTAYVDEDVALSPAQ